MNAVDQKSDVTFFADASTEELQNIITDHPYFSPAHFFLAKKMKYQNHPDFLKQLQRTAIYFSNPYWLHYQLLQQNNNAEKIEFEKQVEVSETILPEKKVIAEELLIDEDEKKSLEEDIHKVLAQDLNELPTDNVTSQKLSNILEEQAAAFKKPVDETAELPIEKTSYHTIDYFASQGIKLDSQTQDNLEKRVLRFTDWLKQMKRISPQPLDLGTETALENKVLDSAAHSIEPKEIVTEAMAEVLEKQGKTAKAIELYEKLSLLHPDKSVYFASQIKKLKGL